MAFTGAIVLYFSNNKNRLWKFATGFIGLLKLFKTQTNRNENNAGRRSKIIPVSVWTDLALKASFLLNCERQQM